MSNTPNLPEAYSFAQQDTITPDEVIALRDASNWGTERRPEIWKSAIEQSLAVVGIRHQNDSLVGVGFLSGNIRHALLCDFTVHPEHRRQGLGTAILDRRISIADEIGVRYLYTDIAQTNTIKKRYIDLGFHAAGGVLERSR